MEQISRNILDIQDSTNSQQLALIQACAPVLANFICKCPKIDGKLPDDVCGIIRHILTKVERTHAYHSHPASSYGTPNTHDRSFFPAWPTIRSPAKYAADSTTTPRELDDCRKASYGHPSLTPGVFTVYCPHGVCYGFEIMQQCESPKHPFTIFTCHFPVPPGAIVYDNGCKLHSYCLNREPALYKDTRFFIDRFHWRGHIGCSKGYCLDEYSAAEVRSLNSQVNEQANLGLQRIKGHLSYMKPDNFRFTLSLFLAICNKDKLSKLNIDNLTI